MTETSATIIDLGTYRTNKRARAQLSPDKIRSTDGAVGPYFAFCLFLALIPFALMGLPASEESPRE